VASSNSIVLYNLAKASFTVSVSSSSKLLSSVSVDILVVSVVNPVRGISPASIAAIKLLIASVTPESFSPFSLTDK
jgi:hypothetical protein